MPYSRDCADIDVCVDCLSLLANGEVWDENGENVAAEHAARVNAQWPDSEGWQLVPACPEECEGSFSWQSCEGCGSQLAGDRHPAAVFRYVREDVPA